MGLTNQVRTVENVSSLNRLFPLGGFKIIDTQIMNKCLLYCLCVDNANTRVERKFFCFLHCAETTTISILSSRHWKILKCLQFTQKCNSRLDLWLCPCDQLQQKLMIGFDCYLSLRLEHPCNASIGALFKVKVSTELILRKY